MHPCGICLANFAERRERWRPERCDHRFHLECIITWLDTSNACPFCSRPINRIINATTGECSEAHASVHSLVDGPRFILCYVVYLLVFLPLLIIDVMVVIFGTTYSFVEGYACSLAAALFG